MEQTLMHLLCLCTERIRLRGKEDGGRQPVNILSGHGRCVFWEYGLLTTEVVVGEKVHLILKVLRTIVDLPVGPPVGIQYWVDGNDACNLRELLISKDQRNSDRDATTRAPPAEETFFLG